MEGQIKIVSKKEAHELIDSMPGNFVTVLTYDKTIGLSGNGEYIKKKRCKKMADSAKTIVYSDNCLIAHLDLHNVLSIDGRGAVIKSIMLAKIKQSEKIFGNQNKCH